MYKRYKDQRRKLNSRQERIVKAIRSNISEDSTIQVMVFWQDENGLDQFLNKDNPVLSLSDYRSWSSSMKRGFGRVILSKTVQLRCIIIIDGVRNVKPVLPKMVDAIID